MNLDPDAALEDIDSTLELIDEIENDYPRVWDRGEAFLSDVREKMTDVRETIADRQEVTMRQQQAIDNWAKGVRRWHPQHRD